MKFASAKSQNGFTLIEAVFAIVVIAVAALAGLTFEYHAAIHSKIARTQITAAHLGEYLLEDYKSRITENNYNPALLGVGFTQVGNNTYKITRNEVPYTVNLSFADLSQDSQQLDLRKITATIRWKKDYSSEQITQEDPKLVMSAYAETD